MFGVAMPRLDHVDHVGLGQHGQIELTFSGLAEVCDSGPISATAHAEVSGRCSPRNCPGAGGHWLVIL